MNKKSWSDARVACVSQQAELASIHSPVEQSHITLEVGPYGLHVEAWIGNNTSEMLRHLLNRHHTSSSSIQFTKVCRSSD